MKHIYQSKNQFFDSDNTTTPMQTIPSTNFRRIGQGFCGSVWVAPAGTHAMKREDGGPGRSLHHDYATHQHILAALSSCSPPVRIPQCHQFVYSNDQTWWDDQISGFPTTFQIPCNILITERIPPFGKSARQFLIDFYCPAPLKALIETSEPDQDCIISPHLGRRRRISAMSRFHAFSLRNYSLHVDQIERLGLDGMCYARIMAETMALLYWKAHVEANDV